MPKIVDKKELKILEPNSEKKKIYDEEIATLLDKLKLLCEKNNFPVFITLCIDPNAKVTYKDAPTTKNLMNEQTEPCYESMYKHDFVSTYTAYNDPNRLSPDYIAECIKIIQGFVAKIPTKDILADEDDF